MLNKENACLIFTMAVCIFIVGQTALAMSAPGHLNGAGDLGGAFDLIGTPVEQGGLGNYPKEKIKAVGEWMDNPAGKTGRYTNRKIGELLRPSNHGHLRHNPEMVEKVFKNPAAKNAARIHKIQDVCKNTAGVDGWRITPKMRKEAGTVLRYVRRFKRLPQRLPAWVDQSGPLVRRGSAPATRAANAMMMPSKKLPFPGAAMSMRVVVPLAAALAAGMAIYEYERIEAAHESGEIDDRECRHLHNDNVFRSAAGLAAAGAMLVLPVSGPALVVLGGTIVAFVAVDYTAGQLAAAYSAWQDREIERQTVLLAQSNTAIGVFDIEPDLLSAAGVSGPELEAYRRAWAGRGGDTAVSSPAAAINFDADRFIAVRRADFLAGIR